MKYAYLILVAFAVAGCQITDTKPHTVVINTGIEKPKQFILLDAEEYEGDLIVALFQEGFKVKPIAITQKVTELESPTKMVEYKEAGNRYALKLSISHNYGKACVFSKGHIVSVTMSVIDISSNETLAVLKQDGPDGECPPLTPVWSLLAKELSKSWK
jgi:hypothetical protein